MLEPPERTTQVAAGRIRHVTLEVTVESAVHLPKMDQLGTCDPFCTVQWTGASFQTRHIPKSYEPVWNETFAFRPFDICGAVPPPVPPFSISLSDYNSATSQELFGVVELGEGVMGQVVLAPKGWAAKASFTLSEPGYPEKIVTGKDGEVAVVNIEFKVSWTEEADLEWQAERERQRIEEERLKSEERARKREEDAMAEEAERAERIAAKRRPGPTFFGGGRLGNAAEIEAAAQQGENWSKRNGMVVNSDKRTEAQLRALAAAETRRLGSSGRLADRNRAAIIQSALADGNALGRAVQESGLMTYDACRRDTLASAALRRQQREPLRARDSAAPRAGAIVPVKSRAPAAVGVALSRASGAAAADAPPLQAARLQRHTDSPDKPPVTLHMPHREGLLCANDLERYASLNQSSRDEAAVAPDAHSSAWGCRELHGIQAAATAINSSSFVTSPRMMPGYSGQLRAEGAHGAGRDTYGHVGASRDEEGDDLLSRARALIAAGEAVSGALAGMGGPGAHGEGLYSAGRLSQIKVDDQARQVMAQTGPSPRLARGRAEYELGGAGGEEGGESEMDMLARIRGIARSILGGGDVGAGVAPGGEETGMEQSTRVVDDEVDDEDLTALDGGPGHTSFGARLAGIDKLDARGGDVEGEGGWSWMGGSDAGRNGLVEPSTATLPSVESRAESDLSEGIPVAGRGGNGRRQGGWGGLEEEEDGGEQRVVLQGMRLRGHMCGRDDNPEISFMLKIDMGGFKCRTDKERRLRGEVSWKSRCELDLVGCSSLLRVRVVRCRQPRGASQSADSIVGECEIPVEQLEGSDRAVSWGWHRVLGLRPAGDEAASGELHLGIERFRVSADDDADGPEKESKGTMPDEVAFPDLNDPVSKAGAGAVLQRSWRCHLARRAARATIQWRESLQRKSHRAFPGSLGSLAGNGSDKGQRLQRDAHDDEQLAREGAAAMYSRRRPPPARGLAFGVPGAGVGGVGVGQGARMAGSDAMRASARLSSEMGRGSESGMGGMYSSDGAARGAFAGPARHFPLDALFPLSKAQKSSFRLPPPTGVTDARGGGGAAERSWGGGGEGLGGLYAGKVGYGGEGGGYSGAAPSKMKTRVGGSDLGEQWDKIHGAAALLLG